MLRILKKQIFSLKNTRGITTNKCLKNTDPTSSNIGKKNDHKFESNLHATSNFDKRILVLTKKYAKIEDVPNFVPLDVMQTSTSRLRIRVANYIILTAIIVFTITAIQGHQKKMKKLAELKIEQDITRREIIASMKNETK